MKLLLLIALGVLVVRADHSQVLRDFSVGYTQFTADVYKELLKSNSGNFLVCPLSVDVILALTAHGAKGKTAQQLSAGLHLPEDKEKRKEIFRELGPHLKGNNKYTLTSANKIYLKNTFKIVKDFNNTAVNVFKAEIQNIDFEKAEAAASEINKWAKEKTHEKIKNVISRDDLDEDTRAVLVNAMYFHGKWVKSFNEKQTKKRNFYNNNKKEVKVDMMEVTEHYNYYESHESKAKFLELPYEGGDITMTFVLPDDIEGLPDLEARVADVLVAPQYRNRKVHVVVPKFKIKSTIQFKPIFQSLGVVDAFEDYADFSGLSKDGTKINRIVQKVLIEVDEKGTTAAAVTAVVQVRTRSRLPKVLPPKEFVADHPFIYYLKSPVGVIFIGRFVQH